MTKQLLRNIFANQLRTFGGLLVIMLLAWPCAASESNAPHASHDGSLVLSVNGDRINARIENESLRKVLAELGKRARIKVVISPFTDDRVISSSFDHLLLSDVLKRFLWNRNYIFSTDGGRLLRVLGSIGSQSSLTTAQSTPIPQDSPIIDRANDLYASDPELRLAALKELAQKGEAKEIKDAQPVLIAALEDEGEYTPVRKLALETLDRLKKGAPIDTLASVASGTDPDMRVQALALIVERGIGEAAKYLSQAMDDPDPKVRSFAIEVSENYSNL